MFFTVQIGAFKKINISKFDNVHNIILDNIGNKVRVCTGKFNNLLDIDAFKNTLVGLGFKDAFVVAYYNGKKITMKEAKNIYYNRFDQ